MSQPVETVTIVKIGGNVIDDDTELQAFLTHFARIAGPKVLVHGGGKLATDIAKKLGLPQTMIEGRRVTDAETLKILTMVYGGSINKHLVARLFALGCRAFGITGADADVIRSRKRAPIPIDYGLVGDIEYVKGDVFWKWLEAGSTPIVAPLTHDGKGQILNTNADTIANEIAVAIARDGAAAGHSGANVELIFTFEKPGVLLSVHDDASVLKRVTPRQFAELRADGKVFAGMIPKLDNACKALAHGVKRVVLGRAQDLPALVAGTAGTSVVHD